MRSIRNVGGVVAAWPALMMRITMVTYAICASLIIMSNMCIQCCGEANGDTGKSVEVMKG